MKTEKSAQKINGYLMLGLLLLIIGFAIIFFANEKIIAGSVLIPFIVLLGPGFLVINPNNSMVMLLFGAYKGTIKENGFFWANPFFMKKHISLKARNFESERIKVNDKLGNPIMISAILVWKVSETYKAMFEVDSYEEFVKIQTDSAVRKLASSFPYDQFEDAAASITLSSSFEEVNHSLEEEISERLKLAGLTVIEARIGYLAYAPEIAQVMLKRQQATAIIAARSKIVEGAVGMVESALHLLSEKSLINLDEEKKAAMVSNLMIVLCGDKDIEPVINTGTLHQ